ncbi:hypothetical protein [Paractinoplanes durhamensis]|uniref:hypothetical protein n=1 Tax=Paractinoplanes durhamensis TaxID=113563 RepID=UPI003627DFBF
MLLLTIGLPALLAGAALWTAMQHRDQGGAFSGELQRLATPGYAYVVSDVDQLLRTDAPFTRIGDTQLRINAGTQDGPAFVGLAPSAAVDEYLQGVPHVRVRTVDIGTGALPVATYPVGGREAPRVLPARASFWLRSSADGDLAWSPGEVTGGPYSLVIMSPGAKAGIQLTSSAELRPGWINSSTWGLLTLGTLLAMTGLIILAWPARRREIVYVVEPSQVPNLMAAIGVPLPLTNVHVGRGGAHRPRTLADAEKAALEASASRLTWPPAGTPALTGPAAVPVSAVPASGRPSSPAHASPVPVSAVPASGVPVSAVPAAVAPSSPASAAAGSGASGYAVAGSVTTVAGLGSSAASPGGSISGAVTGHGSVAAAASGSVASAAGSVSTAAAGSAGSGPAGSGSAGSASTAAAGSVSAVPAVASGRSAAPDAAEYAAATAIPGRAPDDQRPAPGEPLNFIKPTSGGALPLGDYPSSADPLFGRRGSGSGASATRGPVTCRCSRPRPWARGWRRPPPSEPGKPRRRPPPAWPRWPAKGRGRCRVGRQDSC